MRTTREFFDKLKQAVQEVDDEKITTEIFVRDLRRHMHSYDEEMRERYYPAIDPTPPGVWSPAMDATPRPGHR